MVLPGIAAENGGAIPAWVEQLGSDSPEAREAAENGLAGLGDAAFPALFEAALGSDFERARRARRLITRLESAAFEPLHREAKSADAARAALARLLLEGLTERLLERKFRAFEQRLERAEQEGRITATERLSWTITLQQSLSIDKRGRVSETVPDRRLACLEAVPLSRLAPARPLDAAKLQAFRGGGELPDPVYAPAWKAFVAKVGEGPGRRGLFADMLAGEPALLADAAEVFATAGQQAAAARGRSLGGVFDLRAQDLITEFAGTVRKLKPVPGQRYTDVNDERILGRLTALLFVSSELPEHLPTPTLSWVWNMLQRGPIGYLDGLVAMLGTTQNERAQAVRTLLESAAHGRARDRSAVQPVRIPFLSPPRRRS